MAANFTTMFFTIINIIVWILMIRVIFKGIQKVKQVYSKIDNMDKKIDCILQLEKKEKNTNN